jgi:iron complex transport system substrate-binding protein
MRALSLFALLAATPALSQEFPLTLEHRFGTSVIPEAPIRVASVDYAGADDLLALGVQPVTIRDWYGDHPRAVWPWAEPLLTDPDPVILRGDLDFEAIAAADPDVILALWSGIDQEQYDKLSLIAPVVAVPEGVGDYALSWDTRALLTGQAIGRAADARAQVDGINARLDAVAAAHPDWQGLTAAVAHNWDGTPGAYTATDIRPQILARLGFVNAPGVEALISEPDQFTVDLSPEDLSPLDVDLLLWVSTDDLFSNVIDMPARAFLPGVTDGREVFVGAELTAAFSHASLLSLPFAIDALVPMIAAARDGDPTTHADQRPEGL